MEGSERESLLELCQQYLREMRLPKPLPTNREEAKAYAAALDQRQATEDAEDAWFELDHLTAADPAAAWELIRELANRTSDEDELATLGAGVLETFIGHHGDSWAESIASEMPGSPHFVIAMRMVERLDDHPQLKLRISDFLPG